jgi:hypothetical protein
MLDRKSLPMTNLGRKSVIYGQKSFKTLGPGSLVSWLISGTRVFEPIVTVII